MRKIKQVSIIGVGLIGGSIAKALKSKARAPRIVGYFRNKQKCRRAVKNKIVDKGFYSIEECVHNSDIVILCLPVTTIIKMLPRIKKCCSPRTIITDVGSTKSSIVSMANKLKLNFVGAHPLAGSEKSGAAFSTQALFSNSLVILTPTPKTKKESIRIIIALWKKAGARLRICSPTHHDAALAFTSHLPHIAAFSLVNALPISHRGYTASGFKDTTRIASSDPHLWSDILFNNKRAVLRATKSFLKETKKISGYIRSNKKSELLKQLKRSQRKRNNIH